MKPNIYDEPFRMVSDFQMSLEMTFFRKNAQIRKHAAEMPNSVKPFTPALVNRTSPILRSQPTVVFLPNIVYLPVTMLAVSVSWPGGALPSLKLELAELKGAQERSLGQGEGGRLRQLMDGARLSQPIAERLFGL